MNDRRDREPTPRGSRPRRFRPVRAIVPGLCVAGGVVTMVRGAVALGANGDPLYLLLGVVLVAVGIIAFFVSRR